MGCHYPRSFTPHSFSCGNLGKPWHLDLLKVFLAETDRERKHTKSRDTVPGLSGKIYRKNFCNRRKVSSLGGVEGGVQGTQEGAWRGQEWGRARGPPGLLGAPLRLHSGLEFSSFCKNTEKLSFIDVRGVFLP